MHKRYKTPKGVIRAMFNHFKKKDGWLKGTLARDGKGWTCTPDKDEACQFCMLGGMMHFSHDDATFHKSLNHLHKFIPKKYRDGTCTSMATDIMNFNDNATILKTHVMKVLQKAVA